MHDRPKRYALFLSPQYAGEVAAQSQDEWQPRADVYRSQNGWILKFDLAGVNPADVSVEVEDGRDTVAGVRRDWVAEEGCSYYSMEINYSRFHRTIHLPGIQGKTRYSMEYRDGILLVRVQSL